MAAFADATDLLALPGLEQVDEATAERLLDLACDAIRAELGGQQIDLIEGDELTIAAESSYLLLLPQLPVVAVTSVTVDGSALTDYTWRPSGVLIGGWLAGQTVTVVYDHGYRQPPAAARIVALQAASRALLNPGGDVSESVGAWSVNHGSNATPALVLTEHERSLLDPLRAD